jgi:molybdenum cofactor cytidylyltransferase
VSIAAVVLAAGASTRLGELKQLVMLANETLLERAARMAREAGCSPVIVILGAEAEAVRARSSLGDAVIVVNGGWEEGMASSVRLGVQTCRLIAGEAEGIVLMTCDQPAVTVQHLQLLMTGGEVKASRYAGRNGVPAFFPAQSFNELLSLTGDVGARTLLASADAVELPDGDLDVDTAEDLARARKLFGAPGFN